MSENFEKSNQKQISQIKKYKMNYKINIRGIREQLKKDLCEAKTLSCTAELNKNNENEIKNFPNSAGDNSQKKVNDNPNIFIYTPNDIEKEQKNSAHNSSNKNQNTNINKNSINNNNIYHVFLPINDIYSSNTFIDVQNYYSIEEEQENVNNYKLIMNGKCNINNIDDVKDKKSEK